MGVGGGGRSSQQVNPGKGWPGRVGGGQEAPEAQPGPAMPVAGRLSVELDYGGGMRFRLQASDLIPVQPCDGVSVLPSHRSLWALLRHSTPPHPAPEPWA